MADDTTVTEPITPVDETTTTEGPAEVVKESTEEE